MLELIEAFLRHRHQPATGPTLHVLRMYFRLTLNRLIVDSKCVTNDLLYDFESNDILYLGELDSSSWALHQTWSPDNAKIAISEIWATGIWTPGPIKMFDTVTDSFTTLVDSTWPPCFWVGETGEQVSIIDETLPITFNLYNAYPNPFNPVTTLRYDLPEDAMVNIIIYDIMGRVVSNLVSSQQRAGYKSIQWNATNNIGQPVSAGLYLYTIQAGEFRQTKKMVLLK